jgi:hypothetical protein
VFDGEACGRAARTDSELVEECGGMGRFVEEAPEAVLACSETGAFLNLTQWDYTGPVRGFRVGETIDLGSTGCASSKPPTFTTGTR